MAAQIPATFKAEEADNFEDVGKMDSGNHNQSIMNNVVLTIYLSKMEKQFAVKGR